MEITINRELAIDELNKYYDQVGVLEENRISPDDDLYRELKGTKKVDDEEAEELDESEINDRLEKSDIMRERIIKAIMYGLITVTEEGELVYKLKTPLRGQKTGDLIRDKIRFKPRYFVSEYESNMNGVNIKNTVMYQRALIATISDTSKTQILKFDGKDWSICQAVAVVFMRGDD